MLKRKNYKKQHCSFSLNKWGRQGRRESKQRSLTNDNRRPDKNSQHTCINTLLSWTYSQDKTLANNTSDSFCSLSLSNKQCDDHIFKHAYTVDCNSLSVTRSLTLCKNFGLLCGTCGKTRLRSLCNAPPLAWKSPSEGTLVDFSGRPLGISVGRHTLSHHLGEALRFTAAGYFCVRNESRTWQTTASRRGPLPRSTALNT